MTPKTVLVVDDYPDQRNIVRDMLRYHGYGVLEAANGAEAVRLAQEYGPDLVLMDAELPVLDGWQATQQLKHHGATSGIPVIMLTAHAMPQERRQSFQSGCDGYLAKPCEPTRVLEEVERWVGAA